jgi:tRNA (guanine-N7-)-methyltransferase
MSDAKRATLRDLHPRWGIPAGGPWDPEALERRFGRAAPVLVDIGVGDGAATRAWARDHPDANVVALEVHRPGLVKLLDALESEGPANVRVAEVDALEVLDALGVGSVRAVRALFPDPWPKRRHVARRLVDRAFARRVAEVLEPGGTLEVATDWPDYAAHARSMVATERRLTPSTEGATRDDGAGDDPEAWRSPRPPRPTTAYEQRGRDAGRPIVDLVWVRRPDR